jgi:hypothetical protein
MSDFVIAEIASPVGTKVPGSNKKGNYIKGLRAEVPLGAVEVPLTFVPPVAMELKGIGFSLTGYSDGDYWELYIHTVDEFGGTVDTRTICETIYTKEVPEVKGIIPVEAVGTDNIIEFKFFNTTGTTKTIWVDLQFLK